MHKSKNSLQTTHIAQRPLHDTNAAAHHQTSNSTPLQTFHQAVSNDLYAVICKKQMITIVRAVKLTFVASLPAKTDQTEYGGPTDIIFCAADSYAIPSLVLDYEN